MEINKNLRNMSAAVALCAGVAVLSGCTAQAQPKPGNEFSLRIMVDNTNDVGTIFANENEVEIISANGKSSEWFTTGTGQDWLGDDYKLESRFFQKSDLTCENAVSVGVVLNEQGQKIKTSDLHKGDIVNVTGTIHESNRLSSGKYRICKLEDWAVYDTVQITHETLQPTKQRS